MDRRTFIGGALASLAGCAAPPVVRPPVAPIVTPAARVEVFERLVRPGVVGTRQGSRGPVAWPVRTPASFGETLPGLYRRDRFRQVISLTFDDGPRPQTTPWILDHLDRADVKATFFVIGRKARKYPALIRDIVKRGHVVGNHTYNHKVLSRLKKEVIADQADRTELAVCEALGEDYPLRFFRPPYGNPFISGANYARAKERVKDVLREQRRVLVMWNMATGDTARARELDQMMHRMAPYLRRGGGVAVLHDTAPWTVHALPKLIQKLRQKGYSFASLDDMLERKYGLRIGRTTPDPRELWITSRTS